MAVRLSTSKKLFVCLSGMVLGGAGWLFVASAQAEHLRDHVTSGDHGAIESCTGGRASCGDRVGRALGDGTNLDTSDVYAAYCAGGRRMCGDRTAAATGTIERPNAGDVDDAPHPRSASR